MDKLDCILDYYASNKSLLLFLCGIIYDTPECLEPILDDKYIKGAQVGIISNILLSIKEGLVENKGNLNYESKLFNNKLEKCVDLIASKVECGYQIDGCIFKDAAELVATIRNKMAHGDFIINFDDNRLVLNVESKNVRINIDKLSDFIVYSSRSVFIEQNSNEYIRTIGKFDLKQKNRNYPLKLKSEIKNVIKKIKCITYKIKSSNPIPRDSIIFVNNKLMLYRKNLDDNAINEISSYLKQRGCTLEITSKRINDDKVDDACTFIMNGTHIDELNYIDQIEFILNVTERYIEPDFNKLNSKIANIRNLFMLDEIKKLNTVNTRVLYKVLLDRYGKIEINYDSLGVAAINMFNSLFSYSFDDLYKNNYEYTKEPNNGLDYSKLHLNSLKIILINEDKNVIETETKINESLNRELSLKMDLYVKNLKNLDNAMKKDNNIAIQNIYKLLKTIETDKNDILIKLKESTYKLENLNKYYNDNKKYFKNKSIIEGIRNSIAHGNYEIECTKDYNDAKIIFSDIYEGKLTFKCEVPILKFVQMMDLNFSVIEEFIENKKNSHKIMKV